MPSAKEATAARLAAGPRLTSWIMAARPRTLGLSMTPVAVGTALAWATDRKVHGLVVLAALIGSVLIQVGTNLHNDALDSERGGDRSDRLGPPRVTASGLLSATAVKRGAIMCFAGAALVGLYLVSVGGWPILVLGLLSIAAGLAYTGGPLPIAYTPLGEVFVVAFFGVGAVCGTYWLNTGHLGVAAIGASFLVGLPAGAVLMVNNHRDAEADTRIGRRTLAVLVGPRITIWIYASLMLLPFAFLPLLNFALPHGRVWPALLALPPALLLVWRCAREPRGRGLNRILAYTVQTQVLFSLLLCAGLLS
ncbi:MAG: 1,4-dihydroxy-2-naphthoate octaprenyltransferase [Alphaproteobacteria bacterium]|nr:1,4-dihydroxy-2-naphthoate octaprenyltransferase [Alphaproteobacteria bacterium]